jgi:hypothetical protein
MATESHSENAAARPERTIATLVAAELAAGEHVATWDAPNAAGGAAGAGIYFARLTFGGQTRMGPVVRVR